MVLLSELLSYLENTFQPFYTKDVSKNGLQISGPEKIERIAFAVDACQQSFDRCAEEQADLLIVHHGLFWRDIELVVENHYKRLKTMIENQIGLYAMHLPLDAHSEIGNNQKLADILEADDTERFIEENGILMGVIAYFENGISSEELKSRLDDKLQTNSLLLPFGPEVIRSLGIVSGGGGKYITDAITAGCDAFLTGEPEHVVYHPAREYKINFFASGHYATETVGLKALQEAIEAEYDVKTLFIDIPTGM